MILFHLKLCIIYQYLAHHYTNKYLTEQLLFHLILIIEVVRNDVQLLQRCYTHSKIVLNHGDVYFLY